MAFNKRYLRFTLLILFSIMSVIAFEEVVDDVFSDPSEGDYEAREFDTSIASLVRKYESPELNQVMTDFTALGSVSVISTLFLILASILISYRDIKGLLYLSTVLIGAAFFPPLLKNYFARPRPLELDHLVKVHDLSFPSGHSFGATCLYIALAYYSGKYARTWAEEVYFYFLGFILIFLVGISRIYLGVHFPTDVLGGISSGAAWGLIVSAVFEFWKQKKNHTHFPS
jgi:undecaprenyl-diphosphatase